MKKFCFDVLRISILSLLFISCSPKEDENIDIKPGGVPFKIIEGSVDVIQEPISIAGPDNDLSDWMSLVDDNTKVCKMSIPGTHDATTGYGFYQQYIEYVYNQTAISQITTLEQQLKRGVRFFDIRTAVTTDTISQELDLRCAHGISEIRLTFHQALTEIHNFITKHPKEFVIVKIQHDNGSESQIRWVEMMRDYISSEPFGSDFFATWHADMKLKDVRGKVLFMNRTEFDGMVGAVCSWPDEDADQKETIDINAEKSNVISDVTASETAALYVQDYYKTTKPQRLNIKTDGVINMIVEARKVTDDNDDNTWIINHCSAYTLVSPRGYLENAETVHQEVIKYLKENPKGTVGIIPMDFACYDTVNCIINGGTPYSSSYLYDRKALSQSLINLIIKTNFPNL